MPILLKLFEKIEEEGTLLKTVYDAIITLVPKLCKDTTKKNDQLIYLMNLDTKFSTKK